MVTAVSGPPRTRPVGWVLRAFVTAHVIAIVGQPVFAGVYLSGDFDALRWHAIGADIVSYIAVAQLITAIVFWVKLGRSWPFTASLVLLAAESVQYLAGMDGALWLHLPLGVLTIAALAVLFIAAWRIPLVRIEKETAGE